MKTRMTLTTFWIILLGMVIFLPATLGQAHPLAAFQDIFFVNLPIIYKNAIPGDTGELGTLQGRIYNVSLQEKPGVGNATVCLGTNCVTTDDAIGNEGWYSFQNVPSRSYQMTVQHPEFYSRTDTVQVLANRTTAHDVGLVSLLVSGDIEMRITVEWLNSEHWPGSDCSPEYPVGCPTDLDAHIWAHYTGGDFHHFQDNPGNCNTAAAVCVELYSYNGPGPETVAIRKISDPNTVYYYGVQNFYQDRVNVPPITNTSAVVRIYRLDGSYQEYSASTATPGDGDFWYLFSMNAQGQITLQNCVTSIPQDPDPNDNLIPAPTCPSE